MIILNGNQPCRVISDLPSDRSDEVPFSLLLLPGLESRPTGAWRTLTEYSRWASETRPLEKSQFLFGLCSPRGLLQIMREGNSRNCKPLEAVVPGQPVLDAPPLALAAKRALRRRPEVELADEGDVEDGGRQVQLLPELQLLPRIWESVSLGGVGEPRIVLFISA